MINEHGSRRTCVAVTCFISLPSCAFLYFTLHARDIIQIVLIAGLIQATWITHDPVLIIYIYIYSNIILVMGYNYLFMQFYHIMLTFSEPSTLQWMLILTNQLFLFTSVVLSAMNYTRTPSAFLVSIPTVRSALSSCRKGLT